MTPAKSSHLHEEVHELGLFSLVDAGCSLPDGVRTLMHLAALSRDLRVREMAREWRMGTISDYLLFDTSCAAYGITTAAFMADVTATAAELDRGLGQALGTIVEILRQPIGVREFSTVKVELLSEGRPCERFEVMRQRWRLSQAQFCRLLMADTRLVERWEARQRKPGPRYQWWLAMLERYTAEHGVDALRRRFVGELPQYGKVGRRPVAYDRTAAR
jgi:DNA-binding transcriptional regulator YiaG